MRKLVHQSFGRLLRFRSDKRGVAAIEFAMVVPLMLMMFVGAVEFSQAITVDRRVSQVGSSTADLVARSKSLTASEMSGIMDIIDELVKPYDHTLLKLTVLNVIAAPDDVNNTTVCWSYSHNGGTGSYPNDSTYTLPTGVVEAGDSVIVAEVEYNYTPLIFDYFIKTTKKLEDKFYLKPRLSSYVKYDGNDCT